MFSAGKASLAPSPIDTAHVIPGVTLAVPLIETVQNGHVLPKRPVSKATCTVAPGSTCLRKPEVNVTQTHVSKETTMQHALPWRR
jgi:hypothetical protein